MVTLKQIIAALAFLGISTEHIEIAIAEMKELLTDLDNVEVKGRQRVDTLLGCMMAIDAIIGNQREGDGNG